MGHGVSRPGSCHNREVYRSLSCSTLGHSASLPDAKDMGYREQKETWKVDTPVPTVLMKEDIEVS